MWNKSKFDEIERTHRDFSYDIRYLKNYVEILSDIGSKEPYFRASIRWLQDDVKRLQAKVEELERDKESLKKDNSLNLKNTEQRLKDQEKERIKWLLEHLKTEPANYTIRELRQLLIDYDLQRHIWAMNRYEASEASFECGLIYLCNPTEYLIDILKRE